MGVSDVCVERRTLEGMNDELIRKIMVELNSEFNFDLATLQNILTLCFKVEFLTR